MCAIKLIQDKAYKVYHLELSRELSRGARAALIPGAPERAALIAESLKDRQKVASHRGLDTWVGELAGEPVLAVNTGMGGPTTEIVVQELIQLGVTCFLRIGTTGSIRADVPVGALVISEAAIRLDGTSDHYAPPCYPAAADFELTMHLARAARLTDRKVVRGITVSSASFYPGQERLDSASGYVYRDFQGSLEQWRALGALNYEMEAGTLFTMCRTMGLSAGAVCAVVANRTESEAVHRDEIRRGEDAAICVGVGGLAAYLEETRNR